LILVAALPLWLDTGAAVAIEIGLSVFPQFGSDFVNDACSFGG
jgi:hypothetical protein